LIAGTSSGIQLAACIYSATWLGAIGNIKFINLNNYSYLSNTTEVDILSHCSF